MTGLRLNKSAAVAVPNQRQRPAAVPNRRQDREAPDAPQKGELGRLPQEAPNPGARLRHAAPPNPEQPTQPHPVSALPPLPKSRKSATASTPTPRSVWPTALLNRSRTSSLVTLSWPSTQPPAPPKRVPSPPCTATR